MGDNFSIVQSGIPYLSEGFRPDFTSKLVHGLVFRTPKFSIVPYDKINRLLNLSYNCDVKSGLRHLFCLDQTLSLKLPITGQVI